MATGWTVRRSNPDVGKIFRIRPDRPWGPPSHLYNGYRVFPGGKERPGRDADFSPPSSAVCHKRLDLYLYTPYRPYGLYRASVPVQGCTLPYFYFAFHYRFHYSPPLSPILSQINFAHVITFYFFKTCFFEMSGKSYSPQVATTQKTQFLENYAVKTTNNAFSVVKNTLISDRFMFLLYCVLMSD
jgi:hypothetical protein